MTISEALKSMAVEKGYLERPKAILKPTSYNDKIDWYHQSSNAVGRSFVFTYKNCHFEIRENDLNTIYNLSDGEIPTYQHKSIFAPNKIFVEMIIIAKTIVSFGRHVAKEQIRSIIQTLREDLSYKNVICHQKITSHVTFLELIDDIGKNQL